MPGISFQRPQSRDGRGWSRTQSAPVWTRGDEEKPRVPGNPEDLTAKVLAGPQNLGFFSTTWCKHVRFYNKCNHFPKISGLICHLYKPRLEFLLLRTTFRQCHYTYYLPWSKEDRSRRKGCRKTNKLSLINGGGGNHLKEMINLRVGLKNLDVKYPCFIPNNLSELKGRNKKY